MSAVIARRAVGARRRWLIGWGLGIAAFVALNIAFYPSFRDEADQMNEMFDSLPEGLRSLFGIGSDVDPFSPIGYLSSQVYQLMLPLLLLIAGIGVAASIAGDEEQGLLETTFALPVTRRRVLLERFGAVSILIGTLSLVGLASTAVSATAVDLGVAMASILWASVAAMLLTLTIGSIATAVGAVTGRRGIAVATASVVALAGYVITSLADANIGLFRTLRPLSLFTHYDVLDILRTGRPSWSLLVLVATTLLSLAAAVVALDRRDLRSG